MAGKRILVLQHIAVEHPGVFRDFLRQDGIQWEAVELDQNASIPALDGYDALWVMGGPMDVWQDEQYPWLLEEKHVIRQAVAERELPFFGLCLGHQLLAAALGGSVGPAEHPEIGILDVHLTADGQNSPFFRDLPATTRCLQWHSAEIKSLPPQAVVLASTSACEVQAMSINGNALSLQFHVEIAANTVTEWGAVPEYKQALEERLGAGALDQFSAEAAASMDAFNQCARVLYANWKRAAWGQSPENQ